MSLFWIVTILFPAHHVAAGIPAVGDVLVAVGTLHEVTVFPVSMLFLAHHVAAGIPAVADILNA